MFCERKSVIFNINMQTKTKYFQFRNFDWLRKINQLVDGVIYLEICFIPLKWKLNKRERLTNLTISLT